ncbi:MAG: fimbrillin family protein [Rikenellaceae bacterium]
MKFKSILIAILVFLISCESSNVDNIYTSRENISFFISQDSNCTKGTPIDSVEMLSNIGVFATLTQGLYADAEISEPNLMRNKLVEHVGDKWVYKSPQEWTTEPNELISFFAYAPFASDYNGITIVEESDKMPTIRYQVPQENTLQPDLMVAKPAYNRVKDQGAVGLTFRHALAAISFSVKGDASRKITAVTLSNIVAAATLSLDSSDIDWGAPAKRSDQSYNLGIKEGSTAPGFGGVSSSITASNGYLMMIPQDITDVTIEVKVEDEVESIDLNFESGSEWIAGAKYNYIIDLKTETIEYDITQTSNCYIVKNTEVTEVYIPIDQRINTFWYGYSGLSKKEAKAYMIDSDTEWSAKIEWCDNAELYTGATTVERFKGFIPAGSKTSMNFVCDGTKAVMKVTLPANGEIGNILISVNKTIGDEEIILWSWHLWVTDYNPDSENPTPTDARSYIVEGGEIHRYTKNSDYWTTGLYAKTFAMDRDLGSHDDMSADGLFYQWGRKDPFSLLTGWEIVKDKATFATAVQTPNTFYARAAGWCSEPTDTEYGANDYLWYDISIPNNDENIFNKSLFDPSPLGWCVPVSAAYEEWESRHDYTNTAYFEMSGHIIPNKGILKSDKEITSFWFSDRSSEEDDDDAYYHYLSGKDIWVKRITTAYGHRIRPVKITD